jgi:hypothetical protein
MRQISRNSVSRSEARIIAWFVRLSTEYRRFSLSIFSSLASGMMARIATARAKRKLEGPHEPSHLDPRLFLDPNRATYVRTITWDSEGRPIFGK